MVEKRMVRSRRNRFVKKVRKAFRVLVAVALFIVAFCALFMSCMYFQVNFIVQMALLVFGIILVGLGGIVISEDV